MKPRVPSEAVEGLLYATVVFGPFAFGCVEPWSRATLEILSFLLALACFLRGGQAPSRIAARAWLLPAGVAAYGLLQRLHPSVPDFPRPPGPFTAAPHETEGAILLWLSYAALLWSVPRALGTHTAARRYVRVLFGIGVALAALGLAQAASGDGRLYWTRYAGAEANPFGSYFNRDHAANILLMSAAAGIGLFFSKLKRSSPVDGMLPAQARLLGGLGAAVLLVLAGLAACRSRGAFLAIALAAPATALAGAPFAPDARARRARAAAALAAFAVTLLFAFSYAGESVNAGARSERAMLGRIYIYGDSLRWLRGAPLFGTGLGSFEAVYPAYQNLDLRAVVSHAHCDWLEFALETGAAGFAAMLGALLLGAAEAARAWRGARSREMRALVGGGIAAAAAFGAHALVDFPLQIPGNAAVFAGVAGFLLSARAWSGKGAGPYPEPPTWDGGAAAAMAALLLCLLSARPALAAWQERAAAGASERIAGLAKALSADDDARYLSGLSAALPALAGAGPGADVSLLRASVGYGLAAADRRPFDAAALTVAGQSLWRLGRVADARDLFDRADAVRFSRYERAKPSATRHYDYQRLLLESTGLVPARGEAR